MKTQFKTLIAVAATGLMLAGAGANAQTYDRYDRGQDRSYSQSRYGERTWQSEKLRYDRAIVTQVNDLRAQLGHASRTRQISRREASQYQDRLDRILDLKHRYDRTDMGLDRREYSEVTSRLSDLSSDIDRNRPARYW